MGLGKDTDALGSTRLGPSASKYLDVANVPEFGGLDLIHVAHDLGFASASHDLVM